jgi:hypothetical protein
MNRLCRPALHSLAHPCTALQKSYRLSFHPSGAVVAINCRQLAVVFDLIGAVFGSFEVLCS